MEAAMFENDQTVVCAPKAFSSPRNAKQCPSRLRISARLGAPDRWPAHVAAGRVLQGVWHAKIGVSFARRDGSVIAGSPQDVPRSHRDLWVLLGLCAGLLFTACPSIAHAASGRVTIESGGVTRSAILVEHARLKKTRRPVIIILHSGGGGAVRVRHTLGLEDKARSASPVMVYPEAIAGHWSDAAKPGDTRDATFIHDLIAKLISEGIADRHRIFIVGGSSGGIMALKLACSGAEDFAGVVAIFASLPTDLRASCKPAHPLPLLLILGTADPFVPYNGGEANLVDIKAALLPGSATLDLFAKAAGCGDAHTTTTFADHDTKDNSRAYLDKLTGCKVPVELLRIEGGGHLLPRIGALGAGARAPEGGDRAAAQGMRNRDVDAPLLIWDFLRHLGA
jgi:polyhydroxybutyrate depolymerase